MGAEPMILEPELEAILREVAADPNSTLLRMPRTKVAPTLFDERPDRVQTTGLSVVERELLRAHRNEVAWLLREACVYRLVEEPESSRWVSRYTSAESKRRCLSRDELREKVDAEPRGVSDRDAEASGLALLRSCVSQPLGSWPTVPQLAAASHRLSPSAATLVIAGDGLRLRGQVRTATALMHDVIRVPSTDVVATAAWERLGACYAMAGMPRAAHDAYRHASLLNRSRMVSTIYRLLFALQVGDSADALETSSALELIMSADHPYLNSFINLQMDWRRLGNWTPSLDGQRLARALDGSIGVVGRRISHVFVEA